MNNVSLKFVRWVLHIPQPTITQAEAFDVLREYCMEHHWEWEHLQPLRIKESLRSYVIWTNEDAIGGKLIIDIDFYGKRVRHVHTIPY